jgi:hypothetical protein
VGRRVMDRWNGNMGTLRSPADRAEPEIVGPRQ